MLGGFVKIEFLDKKLTFIIVWYDEEFLAVYIKDNWVLTPVFTSAASKIKTGLKPELLAWQTWILQKMIFH